MPRIDHNSTSYEILNDGDVIFYTESENTVVSRMRN